VRVYGLPHDKPGRYDRILGAIFDSLVRDACLVMSPTGAGAMSRRSHHLHATTKTGTKQSFVCVLIRVIAAVPDQAYVIVRITGPRDT
jgi:hypothetical protein